MITTSFTCKTQHLSVLQMLVKKYDGRFTRIIFYGSIHSPGNVYVSISFEDYTNFREFQNNWLQFITPIVEVQKPSGLKKLLRRIRGEIKHLRSLLPSA